MDRKTDIIIFGGQSNMQGETERLSETEVVDNALEFRWLNDCFVPLKNPVGENITYSKERGMMSQECESARLWLDTHVTGCACKRHTNMVPEFCRAYLSHTNGNVIAIHIAKGSTEIADWIPGTAGYSIIVEKASAGIDLGIDKFGVIRVGRFTDDEYDVAVIEAQDEVCAENDNFIMLTREATELNKKPEYMSPEIGGHYSAKGLETIGRLAGNSLGKFVADNAGNAST